MQIGSGFNQKDSSRRRADIDSLTGMRARCRRVCPPLGIPLERDSRAVSDGALQYELLSAKDCIEQIVRGNAETHQTDRTQLPLMLMLVPLIDVMLVDLASYRIVSQH